MNIHVLLASSYVLAEAIQDVRKSLGLYTPEDWHQNTSIHLAGVTCCRHTGLFQRKPASGGKIDQLEVLPILFSPLWHSAIDPNVKACCKTAWFTTMAMRSGSLTKPANRLFRHGKAFKAP